MQDIHDINGLIEILPFWQKHLFLILAFCILAGLGILLFFYFKKVSRKNSFIEPSPQKLLPYEQALQDLIAAHQFIQPGFDKILSTKCSDAIRRYLEDAFQLQTTEKTTEEFLHNLQKKQIFHGKPLETLATFLEMCDLAKFAKIEFTLNEQKLLLEKAKIFLEFAHQDELKKLEELKKKEAAQLP